jgi:ubiquinone/menaquinone biosynthesis C-methylase UbiE
MARLGLASAAMNSNHAALCSSPEWAEFLCTEVLTPLAEGVDLGEELLEIGPGYGAATRWLHTRVKRLTALELDPAMARQLAAEFTYTNVTVEVGDCTRVEFPDASYDSVGMFTMLHHLSTPAEQFAALAEAFRVLRPGGVLVGSDSLASPELHLFHDGDMYNPIDPARLLVFLQTVGYAPVSLSIDHGVMFAAHKPPEVTGGA